MKESHALVGPCPWVFIIKLGGANGAAQAIREPLLYDLQPAAIDPRQRKIGIKEQGLVIGNRCLGNTFQLL